VQKSIRMFLVYLILFTNANAQKKLENFTVTASPFTVGDLDGSITFGGGFDFSKQCSFYTDFSYIFFNNTNTNNNNKNNIEGGYRIKPALIIFFNKTNKTEASQGFYASFELMFKKVNYARQDVLPIFDGLGNRVFDFVGNYTITKRVNSGSILIGYRGYFSKAKKFGLDIYLGTGIRYRKLFTKGLPDGVRIDEDFFSFKGLNIGVYKNQGSMPNALFGMKLIYRL
jgi:hypothetical protein